MGHKWRPCGRHYPGLLLVDWDRHLAHSVDYATPRRLLKMGWIWRDDERPMPEFSIHRWQDGTHYYVLKPDGDPVPGNDKYDSYDAAHKAGTLWAAKA